MNADNQMDPEELLALATPVARGEVDYAKANRLFTGEAWNLIPHYRYLGNALLSLFTKIASGLLARRRLAGGLHGDQPADARSCSTSTTSIQALRLPQRHARAPERLVGAGARRAVAPDLRHRRASGIRLRSVVPRISWLLMKGFFWRMGHRYVIRDFHPLVFFYTGGVLQLAHRHRPRELRRRAATSPATRRTPAPRSLSP